MRLCFQFVVMLALGACTGGGLSEPSQRSVECADSAVYSIDGTVPTRLGVAQVDGDTLADLILVARGDPSVRLLRGVGNGEFAAAMRISIGSDTRDATMADVDGDGIADFVATGHFDNAVFVRRGIGDSNFAAETRYPPGRLVQANSRPEDSLPATLTAMEKRTSRLPWRTTAHR